MSSLYEEFLLDDDEDTYIYGGLKFTAQSIEGELVEPYIHMETENKCIKFYRTKRFFVVYVDNSITEIIFTMTCWSDDFKAYKLKDNIAHSFSERYHGIYSTENKLCDIDFTDFITENGL